MRRILMVCQRKAGYATRAWYSAPTTIVTNKSSVDGGVVRSRGLLTERASVPRVVVGLSSALATLGALKGL